MGRGLAAAPSSRPPLGGPVAVRLQALNVEFVEGAPGLLQYKAVGNMY